MPKVAAIWLILSALVWVPSAASADNKSVQLVESAGTNTVTLTAKLTNCTEATITVTAELDNMIPSSPLPLTLDAAGRKEFTVVTFTRAQRGPAGCKWHFDFRPGCRAEAKQSPYVYSLPYRGTFPVLQGPFGRFSHAKGSSDEEAIDWAMPEGTEICAARPGTVVAIKQDSDRGGPGPQFYNDDNYVLIKHEDGTVAEYAHLKLNGVVARLGDKVSAGDKIGLSGNTGQSTQPHLHFVVFNNLSGTSRKSYPLEFKGADGAAFKPQQGRAY